MNLETEIIAFLISSGASLSGVAGLSPVPAEVRADFPIGISFAVAFEPEIIRGIVSGPTTAYYAEYKRINQLMNDIAQKTAAFLNAKGFRSSPLPATNSGASLATPLPHKTVATLAGLGWIGKCALLVTREFGSALRLCSVLTEAPLTPAKPVTASACGACVKCVEACPAAAVKGPEWSQGAERGLFFDAKSCRETARTLAGKIGIEATVCGICVAVCPWTEKYLKHNPSYLIPPLYS
jgi:epoxyqueuosine reductase